MLRQQVKKPDNSANVSLADFIAPKESGVPDYIGGFAVTAGLGIEYRLEEYAKAGDEYNSILIQALADRLAEAFAERLHERVRKEFWGYSQDENLSLPVLLKEKYRGIRPAPGYPACPDHTEKQRLLKLLEILPSGPINLSENYMMIPAASVCGYYFSHPQSFYFFLGKIARDQVNDYAGKKEKTVETIEKWLKPNLGYK